MRLPVIPVHSFEDATLDMEALQKTLTNPAWTVPTLAGAWIGSEGLGYLKDGLGFVHLRGAVNTGTTATTAFTLPAGFRPGASTYYTAVQGGGATGAYVFVTTTGLVQPIYTSGPIRLNNVIFLAEN